MSEELLELLKNHTVCKPLSKLHTLQNAKLLSTQLTELMIKHLKDKTKLNTYSKFIIHLCREHNRKQCVSMKNVQIYLKHLPITKANQKNEALYVTSNDFLEDINSYLHHQADKNLLLLKRRAFINQQTQQTLPQDFDYNIAQIATFSTPYEFKCNSKAKKEVTEEQRESSVQFAMAVINLTQSERFPHVVTNLIENIRNYGTLLTCEENFLKWLLLEEKINAKYIVEKFPFLLEVALIEVAIDHLKGKVNEVEIYRELKWIQSDPSIKKKAMDICWALFKIAKGDNGLLGVLCKLLSNQ